jgi:hypothetical protein
VGRFKRYPPPPHEVSLRVRWGAGKTVSDILALRHIAHAAIDLDAPGIAHLPSAASDEGVMYRNLQSVCKKLCFPRHEAALAGVCDGKPRSTYTVAWLDQAFRRRHPAWRKPCSVLFRLPVRLLLTRRRLHLCPNRKFSHDRCLQPVGCHSPRISFGISMPQRQQASASPSACKRCIGVPLDKGGIRERWRNKDMPREGFLNGRYQVKRKSSLCNVPESAYSQAGLDKIGIGVNRQENDFRRAA